MWPDLQDYLSQFHELSNGRVWHGSLAGLMPMRITFIEIEAFARLRGYASDPEWLDEFVLCMTGLDREWLAFYHEQHKRS